MAIRLIIKALPYYERRRFVETRESDKQEVPRKFVKYRKVITVRPFECIEMDIKILIPIVGKKRLFTINYRRSYPQNIKDYFHSQCQNKVITFLSDFIFRISIPRKCCNKE
jgi:hypothetical protein